jgi:phosphoribosylformylglycinamidine synthase
VAEGIANLACVGATPKAVVNCLNFGNPEHPEVMWQLSESIDGMSEACLAFGLPVIGGNVSLYNESGGSDIDPTPVIGLLGVIDSLVAAPPGWAWREGDELVLVGARHAAGEQHFPLGGSKWASRRGRRGGRVPGFDAATLLSTMSFVCDEIAAICGGKASDVTAVHDVSGGGIAAALAEMVAVTRVGATLIELESHGELFAEFPGRFIIATSDLAAFQPRANALGVSTLRLGVCEGERLRVGSMIDVSVDEIAMRRRDALRDALGALN